MIRKRLLACGHYILRLKVVLVTVSVDSVNPSLGPYSGTRKIEIEKKKISTSKS